MPYNTLLIGIVWLVMVIWVIVDAQKRQVSTIFWPLATLITGPLGLLAYGIVRELVSSKLASEHKGG